MSRGILQLKVTKENTPIKRSEFNKIAREVWLAGGRFWHEEILQKHFTYQAVHEYQYAPRSASHVKAKRRKYGHNLPLVFSGESKEMLESQSEVRSTQNGVSVVMRAPKHFFTYRKDYKAPDKVEEVKTFSRNDGVQMARVWEDAFVKEWKKPSGVEVLQPGQKITG